MKEPVITKPIKVKLYPSTNRIGRDKEDIIVTEKLDGSNLGIGKKDGEIYLAFRNNVILARNYDKPGNSDLVYKGLNQWLKDNLDSLEKDIREGSWMYGEWIGMAHIKYPFNHTFNMFAKANLDGEFERLKNLNYNRDLFKYVFTEQEIPEYVRLVPIVATYKRPPSIEELDELYDQYVADTTEHQVEGFIIIHTEKVIEKYVRLKRGVLQDHFVKGEGKKNE